MVGTLWTSGSRAAEPCPRSGGGWVELAFSGTALPPPEQESVLRELRVELGRRSLDVCLHSETPPASPPTAVVTLLANDLDLVSIIPSRIQDEGGFAGRTIRVGSIPADARALAIAQAIDEVLRGESPTPGPAPAAPTPNVSKETVPVVASSRPSPLRLSVAVGPEVRVAPSSSTGGKTILTGGGALRVALTYAQFGGSIGAVLTKSTQLQLGSAAIDQFRMPIDISARMYLRTGRLEGTFDLGLLLALLKEEYAPARRNYFEVEPGVRAGLTLSWGDRIVPWVGASLEVLPAPYDLRFAPVGSVGRTPSVWFGFSLGMELRWP